MAVQAELVYQSVQPGLQDSFTGQESPEIDHWLALADAADFTPIRITAVQRGIPGRLPAPALGLRVQGGRVRLEWEPVPGAADYLVRRLDEPYGSGPGELLGTTANTWFELPLDGSRGFYQATARR